MYLYELEDFYISLPLILEPLKYKVLYIAQFFFFLRCIILCEDWSIADQLLLIPRHLCWREYEYFSFICTPVSKVFMPSEVWQLRILALCVPRYLWWRKSDDCDFICTPRHLCRRESKPVDLVSYVFRDIYDGGNLKFQSCGFICTPRHSSQREFEVCRSLTSYVLRDV